MLQVSVINWNASERNIELAFKVNFFICNGEKIRFKFYIVLIHRTELVSLSFKNQKEKIFQVLR